MYMRLVLHTASVRLLLALKSFGICQLEITIKSGVVVISKFVIRLRERDKRSEIYTGMGVVSCPVLNYMAYCADLTEQHL